MERKPAKRQRTMPNTSMSNGKLDITGEVVKLKVGKDPNVKIFNVHENVLKKGSSAFLRTTLKSEWVERRGYSDPINLEHYDLEAFELYVKWLYSGDIVIHESQWTTSTKVYVLGEKVQDREFQNAVMTWIVDYMTTYPDRKPLYPIINRVYNKLPENSPLRRFIVDLWASTTEPSGVKKRFNRHYNCQFLIDVIIATKEMRSTKECRKINTKPGNIQEYLHQDLRVDNFEQEKAGMRQDQESIDRSISESLFPTG